MRDPSITVAGRGNLGRSLARALKARLIPARTGFRLPRDGILFLAVPDGAVPQMAARIAAMQPPPGLSVVHLSGALGLDALKPLLGIGSFHPLQSFPFPRPPDAFRGSAHGAYSCAFTPNQGVQSVRAGRFRMNSQPVVYETVDHETIVVNLDTGSYYDLNESGGYIFGLLERGSTIPVLAQQTAARYGIWSRYANVTLFSASTHDATSGESLSSNHR